MRPRRRRHFHQRHHTLWSAQLGRCRQKNAQNRRNCLTSQQTRVVYVYMMSIKFGTDGWRAVIAEDFTFANVDRVAQATADHWSGNPVAGTKKEVVVGFDRRFLSDQFARRAAEVFCGNGFQVVLTAQPTPTPAVSFAVKARRAVGGVMITASHNPAAFNGFKLKAHYGGSAETAACQAVEALLDQNPVRAMVVNRVLP